MQSNKKIFTAAYPYEVFYSAEERHQKYKLQRYRRLWMSINRMFPNFTDIRNSTAVTRVNAYQDGYGKRDAWNVSISGFDLSLSG